MQGRSKMFKKLHKVFLVPVAGSGLDSDLLVNVTMEYYSVEPLQVT